MLVQTSAATGSEHPVDQPFARAVAPRTRQERTVAVFEILHERYLRKNARLPAQTARVNVWGLPRPQRDVPTPKGFPTAAEVLAVLSKDGGITLENLFKTFTDRISEERRMDFVSLVLSVATFDQDNQKLMLRDLE